MESNEILSKFTLIVHNNPKIINFRYHLGTIALGSFVKVLCLTVVIFLMVYYATTKKVTLLYHFLFPFAWIFFMEFVMLTLRGVYAHTAIFGTNFWTSAGKVIGLVKENFGKFSLTIIVRK